MKIILRKILLFACLCTLGLPAFSQKKSKIKKTFRADFAIPRPLANKAFDTLFSGVFNVNLSLNFGYKNFNTGIYGGLQQCQIYPRFESDPHAIQSVYSTGLKLSYDIFPSPVAQPSESKTDDKSSGNYIMYSPFIQGGYSQVLYSRLKCLTGSPTGTHVQTFNLSGGININLMFSDYDGVGLTLGYMFLNHEFNPDPLCLTQYYPNIRDKYKHGDSQYLFFGFNWYLDLLKRDKEYK